MVIVLIVVVGIGTYLGSRWKNIAQSYTEAKIQQLTGGFYQIKFGKIYVEILRRRVKIEDISLHPDSTVFAHFQAIDSLPPLFTGIKLGTVIIQGIHLAKEDDDRMLKIKKLWIEAPQVYITHTGRKKETSRGDTIPKNLHQLLSHAFNTINIDEVSISDGKFHYTVWKPHDTTHIYVDHFELIAQRFLVDSTAHMRKNRLYCDDIVLTINKFNHTLPSGLFVASFDKMKIGMADSTLSFNGLKLTPQYGKHHFAIKNPRHTNWMDLSIGELHCMKIDYYCMLSEKSIRIDSISIADILYANMKNREVEQAPIIKPMLYEYIQQVPLPLHIRTIHVQQATVTYEDLPKGKTTAGVVTLNKIEGDFYDVTNIVTHKNQYMTVKAKAYVQEEGILQAVFKFPVDPHNDHFELTGSLGRMHLERMNSIIEPFLVSIKKGMVDHIDFSINGNHKQAHMDMLFQYNNLNISLLKERDDQTIRKNFVSGIANGIILFNNNPDLGEAPRRVKTITQRNIYRASFHYFWHTLVDGLQETVGFTKKRQKQLKWLKIEAQKMHILKEQ